MMRDDENPAISLDDPRYLLRMAEMELLDRVRRATERRIRQAKVYSATLVHFYSTLDRCCR
jgi:hypothetical protein